MFLTRDEKSRLPVDPEICRICGAVIALPDTHIDYHAWETQ